MGQLNERHHRNATCSAPVRAGSSGLWIALSQRRDRSRQRGAGIGERGDRLRP